MLKLNDLMQRDVVAVSPDLSLRELLEVFTEQGVSGAPVISGGKVVGVVSTTDIYDLREDAPNISLDAGTRQELESLPRRGAPEFFADSWEPTEVGVPSWVQATRDREWDILDEYRVSDVMTREVISQPSGTALKKAARYMLEAGVHRILVIDRGELQGIVTTTDIVRAVADGKIKG